MFSNQIKPCVSQQLQRPSNSNFFQSALLRCWQPFSVMLLFPEYKHSYRGITISGAATVPSPVARSRYLRFCFCLIYLLITEVEDSQSAEIGSAEGDAPLLSDVVSICIKLLLPNHNLIDSSFSLSLSSTARRKIGRSAAAIFFLSAFISTYLSYRSKIQTHSDTIRTLPFWHPRR